MRALCCRYPRIRSPEVQTQNEKDILHGVFKGSNEIWRDLCPDRGSPVWCEYTFCRLWIVPRCPALKCESGIASFDVGCARDADVRLAWDFPCQTRRIITSVAFMRAAAVCPGFSRISRAELAVIIDVICWPPIEIFTSAIRPLMRTVSIRPTS